MAAGSAIAASSSPSLWPPSAASGLPAAFIRLGWLGVWLQLVIIAVDVVFMIWVLLEAERAGASFGIRAALVGAGLAVMLFTTFWFFRYARLGRRMLMAAHFPDFPHVVGTLWKGLWASVIGIVLSLLLLYLEAGHLLTSLLAAPQAGGAAAIATGPDGPRFLTAFDGISLMGSLVVLTVELSLLGMTLWLLFRSTGHTMSDEG